MEEKRDVKPRVAAVEASAVTDQLEGMGYKQEMKRNLGMISVLGLSFAIMAVPFGTSTTLNIALTDGGPVTILYGVSHTSASGERLGGESAIGCTGADGIPSGCSCLWCLCAWLPVWRKCEF